MSSFAGLDRCQENWLEHVPDCSKILVIKSPNNILETEVPDIGKSFMARRIILSPRASSSLPTSLGLTTLATATAAGASAPILRGVSLEVTFTKPTFRSASISSETEHEAVV